MNPVQDDHKGERGDDVLFDCEEGVRTFHPSEVLVDRGVRIVDVFALIVDRVSVGG